MKEIERDGVEKTKQEIGFSLKTEPYHIINYVVKRPASAAAVAA